jgi:C-terminal processing protease CtpA/Prc
VSRPGRLFLLIGRATFSAAGNFPAEIERYTRATLVGEPTGGGVNQYGDATSVTLPATGWTIHIATAYVLCGEPSDRRLAVAPDVAVRLRAADFITGRDPVLTAALKGIG